MKNKIKKLIPIKLKRAIKIILQKIKSLPYVLMYNYYKKHTELNETKVLFLSSSRDTLSGNFLFIYNELKKYDYELNMNLKSKLNTTRTLKEKRMLCKEMAESKDLLVDDFYPSVYA